MMEAELIIKKLENRLSKEEEAIFNQWYEESRENRDYFQEHKKRYSLKGKYLLTHDIDEKAARKRLMHRLDIDLATRRKRPYRIYAIAASLALLVSLGVYFYNDLLPGTTHDAVIEVGSSKAVLTLEDGTEVALEKGETYSSGNLNSDGEAVIYDHDEKKEDAVAYNYLTVPRGGEFFLQLADSTKVWLNSDTKIKYPKTFTDGQPRIVALLYGEAFFEVSPAAKHGGSAFKVTTRNQEIEVLGTQFNVAAYREDQAVTSTLVAGKVTVSNGNIKKELKPGEQVVITTDDTGITITEVGDLYSYMAWKEGYFGYEDKPLKDIMQMLSRWYDVEIKFENKELENLHFDGVLSRREPIEGLLSLFSQNLDYEIKGKEVILRFAQNNREPARTKK